MKQAMRVLTSSETNEYYTPPKYVESARTVMGSIDLDPASSHIAQLTVKAGTYYTIYYNGLLQKWFGNIWLNSPYGKTGNKSNQDIWYQYLLLQYQKGNIEQAVMLIKTVPGYKWYESAWRENWACLTRERVQFLTHEGVPAKGTAKMSTTFLYIGDDPTRFIDEFKQYGRIIPSHRALDDMIADWRARRW